MNLRPEHKILQISEQSDEVQQTLLELNNANAEATSFLSASEWQTMIQKAYLAICIGPSQAFLLVMPDDADYNSPNYTWFQQRYQKFAYVDRIVIARAQRATGLGRVLYEYLFQYATAAGLQNVFCEVNQEPPNPGSDAFHQRMGFVALATEFVPERGKTVQYLSRKLTQPL